MFLWKHVFSWEHNLHKYPQCGRATIFIPRSNLESFYYRESTSYCIFLYILSPDPWPRFRNFIVYALCQFTRRYTGTRKPWRFSVFYGLTEDTIRPVKKCRMPHKIPVSLCQFLDLFVRNLAITKKYSFLCPIYDPFDYLFSVISINFYNCVVQACSSRRRLTDFMILQELLYFNFSSISYWKIYNAAHNHDRRCNDPCRSSILRFTIFSFFGCYCISVTSLYLVFGNFFFFLDYAFYSTDFYH